MPGVDPVPGWLHVSKTDNGDEIGADVERLRWIGADVEVWPTTRVREAAAEPALFQRGAFPARLPHPSAQLRARPGRRWRKKPARASSRIRRRSRSMPPACASASTRRDARVRAAHVVLAGNVHLGALMPRLAATLLPVTTFVMVTEPIGPQLAEVVRYRGAVSDTNRADNHYRIVGGDRLQWSGRMRAWQADPRWMRARADRRHPAQFPRISARSRSRICGAARSAAPSTACRRSARSSRGVWLASGFGGHGLNTTAMGGELVARGIVEADQTWRLFAPYELVWAGGLLGRVLAQGIYWGTRPVERIEQGLARYRERARLRKQVRLAAAADRVRRRRQKPRRPRRNEHSIRAILAKPARAFATQGLW